MKKPLTLALVVAVSWSVFQLYTAAFGLFQVLMQRATHVAFALMLAFLLFPFSRDKARRSILLDYLPSALGLGILAYFVLEGPRITTRMELVDEVWNIDVFFGLAMILCVLEACRRTAGTCLTVVAGLFILYAFGGPYLPGILKHSGTTLGQFIDVQVLSVQGLFSEPIGVSAEIVFYFVLFGAFLDLSGAGKLFGDIACTLTGRTRGGPAKSAVVASSLFGMISGSAVGNVAVVGTFTIPLMKQAGYKPHLAGAIEAAASTGGQIMPPVMGAAAFLMADLTGIPYSQIIVHAAIPAVLFYLSIFLVVDFEAWKEGLRGSDALSVRELGRGLLQRIHLIVPLVLLVYLMMSGLSLMRAALLSILGVVVISCLRRATMMTPGKLIAALEKGAREAVTVAVPSAVAGIVVGVIVFTGLGLKLTGILIQLSGGNLLLALFLTMIACIILGMGMPTSAAYLIAAVLMAPALIQLGVPLLVAHMFVFCFAVISMITPPVALATYAAATIAGSEIWRTGLSAFSIAFASFLIPYAFVYNNSLLFMGPLHEIAWVTATTALGVGFLAAVYVGFLRTHLGRLERVLLFAGALLLIHPGKLTDLVGLGLGLLVLVLAWGRGAAARAADPNEVGDRQAPRPAAGRMGADKDRREGMEPERVFTQDEVREIVDRMARTLAMLYYHLGREVVDTFGAAGEDAVRRGVVKYGDARGRRIREEVVAKGLPATVENLSKFYDLPLPLAWVSRKLRAEENYLEKQVTYCPFAEEWKRLHGEALGAIYCEQDLSMRKGYNPEFELSQFSNVLNGDPHCHTIVRWPQAGTGGAEHV